jgi:hypothetical protein
MLVQEITEGFTPIFGRSGNKTVRKYRCTSGTRRGRIVSKPSTCTAPLNVKASRTMKQTRRSKSSSQARKSSITKRTNPASKRLPSRNVGRRRLTPRRKGRR